MAGVRYIQIDRIFKGLGRLHRSLETTNRKEADKRERMLFTLHDRGRLDILRSIQSGQLSVVQVYESFRRDQLNDLPSAEAMRPLRDALDDWYAKGHGSKKPLRPETLKGYKTMWEQALKAGAFGAMPSIADVTAAAVETYRQQLHKDGHAPMANRFWAAAKSFLGKKLGKRHPQVIAVQDLEKYPEPKRRRPALTVEDFWKWYDATPAEVRASILVIGTTGMMPSELERLTEENFDRPNQWILVPGRKADARARIVGVMPWVWDSLNEVTPWTLDRSRWQKIIKRSAREAGVKWARLYDLRRAFARWHEQAGTPFSRIKAYMGHSSGNVTDGYLMAEVEPYALNDAERMGAYLKGEAGMVGALRMVS